MTPTLARMHKLPIVNSDANLAGIITNIGKKKNEVKIKKIPKKNSTAKFFQFSAAAWTSDILVRKFVSVVLAFASDIAFVDFVNPLLTFERIEPSKPPCSSSPRKSLDAVVVL